MSYASGSWTVRPGAREIFEDAWNRALAWTRDAYPGLESAILIRDEQDPNHYVSVATWRNIADRDAWLADPIRMDHFTTMLESCEAVQAGPFSAVSSVINVLAPDADVAPA